MNESLNLQGEFVIDVLDNETGLVTASYRIPNIVTTAGKNMVAKYLLNFSTHNVGLTYIALGTGNATPAVGDTELDVEQARSGISSGNALTIDIPSLGREAIFFASFVGADVSVALQEVGIFGHDANASADSGVLFARALSNIDNTTNMSNLQITYSVTVS